MTPDSTDRPELDLEEPMDLEDRLAALLAEHDPIDFDARR